MHWKTDSSNSKLSNSNKRLLEASNAHRWPLGRLNSIRYPELTILVDDALATSQPAKFCPVT
uniref:Uncharacterized protein n=1 Tax=Rhizophagus irregularis (strain DAOM 181602 / DAOM 197198 / MUCL 43194) TaxID=747089 RepID=U9SXC0_RHIID